MPRRRSVAPTTPVIPTTALVASSTRYPGKAARIYQPRRDWQGECYRHYAICGEARYAARFFGHAVSRAVLSSAVIEGGVPVEQTEGKAADALDQLFNGKDGQTQILDSIGTHLTVAGECYLVGRQVHVENVVEPDEVWEVISCVEMQVAGDTWQINYGNGLPVVNLTKDDVVIRIWIPSPAQRLEADSPFRSLLPILGEIEWLTRYVFSQITSRLAGAGILFLPQGMTFPPPPPVDGKEVETTNDADAFMRVLADAMLTPIQDPSSPAAQIPVVVTAPGEEIDKAKLLTFWSELDNAAMALRGEAIHRFALGMDLPPEQVLGMSSNAGTGGGTSNGVSHWGAWAIEESTIKLHIEPMLDVIVNALTMGYLRPITEDPSLVVYDSSALRLRPDRSKEAFELYDRGLLSVEALLRENGFDAGDLPTPEQFKVWLLVKIASGSSTPEQVGAALAALGVPLAAPTSGIPVQNGPPPSLEDHPTKPRTPAEAVLAASEALVFRALERAGNRLRANGAKPVGVPAYETHLFVKCGTGGGALLDDAWSCAPMVLAGIADHDKIVPVLDSYCRSLLNEQAPHTRERLSHWLTLAPT